MIKIITENVFWRTRGVLIARFIMGGVFLIASYIKFQSIGNTALYIASANFPFPTFLAWSAAIFELLMATAIITGIFFRAAVLLLAVYAIFLAFVFHGPTLWSSDSNQFKFFINHLVMLSALLYMAAHGPGKTWTLK
jgi:uncharacterized membrane protein YphA (DoxX/SURF4 family)